MFDATQPAHSPDDHPKVKMGRVGILLANLGTPDDYSYWPMRRYLNEFLSDQRVIDYPKWKWQPILQGIILSKRPFSSGEAYKSIWNHDKGESPLMTITKDQTAKLRDSMHARFGDQVMVDFCMRYGNPSTKPKVREMVAAGCDRILFFPLYPQYAGATTATANDQFFRALMDETWQPAQFRPISTNPLILMRWRNLWNGHMTRWMLSRTYWSARTMGCRNAIYSRAIRIIANAPRRHGC
jgi:ferrochelatase